MEKKSSTPAKKTVTTKATSVKAATKPVVKSTAAVKPVKVEVTAEITETLQAKAANVNTQIVETVSEIAENVKEMGQEISEIATKTVKEAATKVDFSDSVKSVKATTENVNKELKDAANVILGDIKEMGEGLKAVATNSIKEVAKNIDLTESVNKAKATAKSVNEQIKAVATEKVEEMKEKTTKIAKDALNAVENIDVTGTVKNIRKSAVKANQFALETSDELIDNLVANTEKWQDLTEKAIKSGLKLTARQQTIVFSTLEAMKTQLGTTTAQFKKLFQNN